MNEIAILAPILTALGVALKGWSVIPDRAIPALLGLIGGLLLCLYAGWTGQNFVLGIGAGLAATGLNQQYRQIVNGHGGSKKI